MEQLLLPDAHPLIKSFRGVRCITSYTVGHTWSFYCSWLMLLDSVLRKTTR